MGGIRVACRAPARVSDFLSASLFPRVEDPTKTPERMGVMVFRALMYVMARMCSDDVVSSFQVMANVDDSEGITARFAGSKRLYTGLIFLTLGVVAVWQSIYLVPTDELCTQRWTSPSPAQEAIHYQWQLFQNEFGDDLPLFRLPDPNLEAEWQRLEQGELNTSTELTQH